MGMNSSETSKEDKEGTWSIERGHLIITLEADAPTDKVQRWIRGASLLCVGLPAKRITILHKDAVLYTLEHEKALKLLMSSPRLVERSRIVRWLMRNGMGGEAFDLCMGAHETSDDPIKREDIPLECPTLKTNLEGDIIESEIEEMSTVWPRVSDDYAGVCTLLVQHEDAWKLVCDLDCESPHYRRAPFSQGGGAMRQLAHRSRNFTATYGLDTTLGWDLSICDEADLSAAIQPRNTALEGIELDPYIITKENMWDPRARSIHIPRPWCVIPLDMMVNDAAIIFRMATKWRP